MDDKRDIYIDIDINLNFINNFLKHMQYCVKDRLSNIRRASFEKPSESAECHKSQSGKQVSIKTCFQDIQGCN